MVHTRPTLRGIIGINWRFLWAYLWGRLAYASWPDLWVFDGPMLWGLYAVSILCGLICFVLFYGNITRISRHYRCDRDVAKFNRHGHAPRSDRMASRNDLKAGGVLR